MLLALICCVASVLRWIDKVKEYFEIKKGVRDTGLIIHMFKKWHSQDDIPYRWERTPC